MVEPDGDTAGHKEDSDSIPHDQSFRVIDLESPSAVELYGKHLKGMLISQALENLIDVLRRHEMTPELNVTSRKRNHKTGTARVTIERV